MKRLVLMALALGAGACAPRTVAIPDEGVRPVPVEVVPLALTDHGLTIQRNADKETSDAFTNAGPYVLVSDGAVFELHRGAQLVGALQVSTLKRRVDPSDADDRNAVLSQIIPGAREQIDVDGLPVWAAPRNEGGRAVYIWFGAHAFGVLQLKGDGLDEEAIATELIGRIATQPAWEPLPPESYEEADDAG